MGRSPPNSVLGNPMIGCWSSNNDSLRWLGGLKNTRQDMTMYSSSGYRSPMSSSGCSLYLRAPKTGFAMKERDLTLDRLVLS
jgi:hypothetical protein